MAFALKLDTSTGFLAQLAVGDSLDIDVISQRTAGTDMTIGANLGAGDELQLGKVGELVRVLGDLTVDGSEIVSTDETITGVFTANGDVNLGSGDGDNIDLGGGVTDVVSLLADLVVGQGAAGTGDAFSGTAPAMTLTDAAGLFDASMVGKSIVIAGSTTGGNDGTFTILTVPGPTSVTYSNASGAAEAFPGTWSIAGVGKVSIGSSVTDYLQALWLQAVNNNGPNADAYRLNASGTNAGAYSIGIDPSLLTHVSGSSTDLMTALDELDYAISSATGTLQTSYEAGNTIAVTAGQGIIDFSNDTSGDSTTVLEVSKTPAQATGSGDSFSGTAPSMTLTDAGAAFVTGMIGQDVVIAGSTTPGNDGTFTITGVPTPTSITYQNASGAAEAFAGTWTIAKTAGLTLKVSTGANVVGDAVTIENAGTGNALKVVDGSTTVVQVNGSGKVEITPTSGQSAVITAAGAGVVDINSAAAVTIDAAANSNFTVAGADLTLSTTTSGNVVVTAAGVLNADAASVEIDATGTIAIESSGGAISIGADAVAQNVNIGTGAAARTITVGNALSTEAEINAILVDINAGASGLTIDAAGASHINTSSGNLSFDAAAAELVFDDVGNSGITLSQTSDRTLAETAAGEVFEGVTSIIGALNALADIQVLGPYQALPIENAITVAAGDCAAQSTTTGRVTLWNGDEAANARFIGIFVTGGTGNPGGTVLAKVALPGALVTDSGASWTAGAALFGPEGTGRPVNLAAAPNDAADAFKRLGFAHTSTSMFLDPGPTVLLS